MFKRKERQGIIIEDYHVIDVINALSTRPWENVRIGQGRLL